MTEFKGVTIMMGAVSEVDSLRKTVHTILDVCDHKDLTEIIIGYSQKATPECLAAINELSSMECDVPVVTFEQIKPFMLGITDMIERARGSHTILVASDMALDLSVVPVMIERAKKEPDVIHSASRWMKGCEFYDYGKTKKFINFCAQKFLAVLYMRNLTDFTIPVQIAPSKLYKSIKFEAIGFPFLLEMVLKPIRLGYKFTEIPTNCYPRTDGKSSNSKKQTFDYLKTAIHVRFMPKKDILLPEENIK